MDIAKQREEFELERLTPLDGRDHLGLVMAFPMPKQQELAAAISIMNDFVDEASYRRAEEENSTADWKPVATRWWHDDYTGLSPTDWNFK